MVDVSDKDGRWTGTTQQAASLIVLLYIFSRGAHRRQPYPNQFGSANYVWPAKLSQLHAFRLGGGEHT